MGKIKPKPHQKRSIIQQTLAEKKSTMDLRDDDCMVISFRHLDKVQGQRLHEWQSTSMLAEAIHALEGACHGSLQEIFCNHKYTVYNGFPPPDKTIFIHPAHVPEDAKWARIHVNGSHCLIGHIVKNTFYLVFLDQHHKFWSS